VRTWDGTICLCTICLCGLPTSFVSIGLISIGIDKCNMKIMIDTIKDPDLFRVEN
jgi:hypothetical protein